MKKSLIILIALTFFMQLSQSISAKEYGSVGFGINYNFKYDLDDLNSNFTNNYIGSINDKCSLINICFHLFNDKNKFIYGADLNLATQLIKRTSEGDSLTSQLYKTSVTFDFGYHLFKKKKVSVFPLIGMGISSNEVTIYRNDLEEDWNNFADSEIENYTISRKDIILKLSLRTELLFIDINKGKSFIPIGIETGYVLPVYNFENTFSTGQSISNFPDYQLDGLFLNFTLGYSDY